MAATNAISGISLVASLMLAGSDQGVLATVLGTVAVACAMANVVGEFLSPTGCSPCFGAPTLENSLSKKDIYRLARCFVEQFIASYATAPQIIVLDMDHSEDASCRDLQHRPDPTEIFLSPLT